MLLLAVTFGCGARLPDPGVVPQIVFPHDYVGNIDTSQFEEPSGLVYHPGRGTLFGVGDEGDIAEFTTDGGVIAQKHIGDRDLEGVTSDPKTGLLYVVVEGEEAILEVDPDSLGVRRSFSVDRSYRSRLVMAEGEFGTEAITFAPDPSHPSGGLFYVANQSFDLNSDDDMSIIAEVRVRLNEATDSTATIEGVFSIAVIDLSGLHYDAASDHLFVISDATNTLSEITRKGVLVDTWALPGDNQEGITVDAHGNWYIAQDSGGIIKWNP